MNRFFRAQLSVCVPYVYVVHDLLMVSQKG
jgi:hypothetical protein